MGAAALCGALVVEAACVEEEEEEEEEATAAAEEEGVEPQSGPSTRVGRYSETQLFPRQPSCTHQPPPNPLHAPAAPCAFMFHRAAPLILQECGASRSSAAALRGYH